MKKSFIQSQQIRDGMAFADLLMHNLHSCHKGALAYMESNHEIYSR